MAELQEYLAEHARRERYSLLTPPRVVVLTDDDLAVGEFGIGTRLVADEVSAEAPPPPDLPLEQPEHTMVYRAPAQDPEPAPEPEPEPAQATVTFDRKTRVVSAPRAVLGRSRECDVRLPDANSSRRHAEIRYEEEAWWIVDLGSTNGTLVNGKRAKRERLRDGDVVTLGSTDIVFGIRS